jgi:hypothetical protein
MKALDLTGQRFNKLTVIGKQPDKTKHGNYKWLCRCDCGKDVVVCSGNLRSGHAISCGCVRRPHGGFRTALYNVWAGIKKRCLNPNNHGYKDYGGRGIKVCDEWLEFVPFRDWALTHGYAKGLDIDRKEVNGNYEPLNCRFVTTTVNNQNRRNTVLSSNKVREIRAMLKKGIKQKDIGEKFGVRPSTISQVKTGAIWSSIADVENNNAIT